GVQVGRADDVQLRLRRRPDRGGAAGQRQLPLRPALEVGRQEPQGRRAGGGEVPPQGVPPAVVAVRSKPDAPARRARKPSLARRALMTLPCHLPPLRCLSRNSSISRSVRSFSLPPQPWPAPSSRTSFSVTPAFFSASCSPLACSAGTSG